MRAEPPGTARSQPLGDPAARLLEAVRQANPVVALLGTDVPGVSAVLDECIARLADDPIRVVRVRGLPGVPLTLSRIVEEVGADQRDGSRVDDDELIVRVLATRSGGESQVVLILEQAELLPLPTLVFLQVALAVFGVRPPRLQLLFAGRPKFAYLIDRDELTPLRDRLDAVIRVPPPRADSQPGLAMPQRAELSEAAVTPGTKAGPNRRGRAFTTLSALMLAAAAATLAQFWYGPARLPPAVPDPVSSPAPAQADPPAEFQVLPQDVPPPPAPALPPQAQAVPQEEAQPPVSPPDAQAVPQDALPPTPTPTPTPPPPTPPPQAAEAEQAPSSPPSREPDVAAPPPERRTLPSSEQLTRLRGEFDRFLAQTEWGSKRLSENERSRLFNEYLRWNYGALAATPDPSR